MFRVWNCPLPNIATAQTSIAPVRFGSNTLSLCREEEERKRQEQARLEVEQKEFEAQEKRQKKEELRRKMVNDKLEKLQQSKIGRMVIDSIDMEQLETVELDDLFQKQVTSPIQAALST